MPGCQAGEGNVFLRTVDQIKQIGFSMQNFQKTADHLILTKYSPPGVIVNEQYDIVQFRGMTGRWLEPSPGRAGFNLLKMAREGLSFELRNILHKAKQTNIAAVKHDLPFVNDGKNETVTIEATVLPGEESHYLVLFHAVDGPTQSEGFYITEMMPEKSDAEFRILQLEKELMLAREEIRSITEEQKASDNRNKQLENTNQYIEAIIDTIRDPIIILDNDLRVLSASGSFYQKFQTFPAETEGQLIYELKNPCRADAALTDEFKQILLQKKFLTDYEFACEIPSVGRRSFSINATGFQRSPDDPLILISMEDITVNQSEKKSLLSKKDQLEERIKLAIEATGIGTWDFDPNLNLAQYDDQCKKLFGFTTSREFGYSDFLKSIDPRFRLVRQEILDRALRGENEGRDETQYLIKTLDDSKIRWISSKGKVYFDEQGKARRLIGTMLDITKEKISEQLLKESEERFRLASEASTALIWMSGTDKLFNYFNKSWLKFTGRTLEQEMGNGWTTGVYPQDLERCLEVYNSQFDLREEFYMEYRLRRYDGTYRWISDSGAPRFSPAGSFEGYVGTCIDIHDQKMTREELENLVSERTASLLEVNNQLEESNQNLSEFAYVASHDLQEPLRKINTFSQLLKDIPYGDQAEEVQTNLQKITNASKRMSRLIEDLLNYARLQNTEEAKVATDLNKIIETVRSHFELDITQSQADIEVGPMPVIQATPIRMSQLFHNLFSNSLKFIQADRKPYISIHCVALSEKEKKELDTLNQRLAYHHIVFSDNGIGFKPEFAEKIFNIFQRLNGRSQYEGTGIGLTICRKIILNHHGLIYAESQYGEGSTFHIILPQRSETRLEKTKEL